MNGYGGFSVENPRTVTTMPMATIDKNLTGRLRTPKDALKHYFICKGKKYMSRMTFSPKKEATYNEDNEYM